MPRAEVFGEVDGRVDRVREFLAAAVERDLARLPVDSDMYDFGPQRELLLARLAELKAGSSVAFYGWQLRPALRPPGMAGRRLYTVDGCGITDGVYERADGTVR